MLKHDAQRSSVNSNERSVHQWRRDELSYCSNVHSGESLHEVSENIAQYSVGVRQRRHLPLMHTGLWLSALAAQALQNPKSLQAFKDHLNQHGIALSSLNGFPYGNFHQQQVKAKVYLPDWSMPQRLSYTQKLAKILAFCLPEACHRGTISTLPLGYRSYWSVEKQQQALQHLLVLNDFLHQLYLENGRSILICIEMEPDCVIDKTDDLILFFNQFQSLLQKRHPNQPCYLASCFDVCHQAVMFESTQRSLEQILNAEIEVGKIQLSSALRLQRPPQLEDATLIDLVSQFSEPRYLHQVQVKDAEKTSRFSDLSDALGRQNREHSDSRSEEEWRIHFHVPIHETRLAEDLLSTTQAQLLETFDQLALWPGDRCKPFLEVETYTWQVLPKQLQPQNPEQLMDEISKEIQWVEQQLKKRALLSNEP
ncbi:MAG: metabolite traffic protein EboE [Xanthomonadales bacterium]|nr:metabolite traffic protein EboE [Xanthomonadales bacterium]